MGLFCYGIVSYQFISVLFLSLLLPYFHNSDSLLSPFGFDGRHPPFPSNLNLHDFPPKLDETQGDHSIPEGDLHF